MCVKKKNVGEKEEERKRGEKKEHQRLKWPTFVDDAEL